MNIPKSMMAVGIAVGIALASPPARASTGGPEEFAPLGYDAKLARVYWQIASHGESGLPPQVFYFDLRASHPERRILLEWSKDALDAAAYRRRLEPLKRGLVPLKANPTMRRIPHRTLHVDSVDVSNGLRVPRYRVRVAPDGTGGRTIGIVTLVDPAVNLSHEFTIPGRSERVLVLAFRGVATESVYETQVPVLWGKGIPAWSVAGSAWR